jgi:hypothetical protein
MFESRKLLAKALHLIPKKFKEMFESLVVIIVIYWKKL